MSELPLTLNATPLSLTLGTDQIVLELGAQIGGGSSGAPSFVSLTVDTTLSADASGNTYNNTIAVADLVATLPTAIAPLAFHFRVAAVHALGVAPGTGDTIVVDDLTIDDSQKLQSNAIGATLDIECHSPGVWLVTNIRGEWDIV